MKKLKSTSIERLILFLFANFIPLLLSATTYYVHSGIGNDENTGTTLNKPWKSLSKVNSRHFLPGDKIFFMCRIIKG